MLTTSNDSVGAKFQLSLLLLLFPLPSFDRFINKSISRETVGLGGGLVCRLFSSVIAIEEGRSCCCFSCKKHGSMPRVFQFCKRGSSVDDAVDKGAGEGLEQHRSTEGEKRVA